MELGGTSPKKAHCSNLSHLPLIRSWKRLDLETAAAQLSGKDEAAPNELLGALVRERDAGLER